MGRETRLEWTVAACEEEEVMFLSRLFQSLAVPERPPRFRGLGNAWRRPRLPLVTVGAFHSRQRKAPLEAGQS
jgi:hypothetical protein